MEQMWRYPFALTQFFTYFCVIFLDMNIDVTIIKMMNFYFFVCISVNKFTWLEIKINTHKIYFFIVH